MSWDLFVGVLIGSLATIPTYLLTRRKYLRIANSRIQDLILLHIKDWEQLIYKLNHSGPVPALTTATGLIGLILWGIGNSISKLKQLLSRQDYDTTEVIIDLRSIVIVELEKLHLTLTKYLATLRTFLEDYQYKQDDPPEL